MKQVDNDEYIHTKLTKGKTPEERARILDKYYGFDEAIQDLEKFIDRHILYDKDEWDSIIEASKREREISMRNFTEELKNYRKKYKDRYKDETPITYSKEEREMFQDLMHYWGE